MAKSCELCGKGSRFGCTIVRHGLPKKKGGIGLHVTGISKRQFLPNVQRIRVIENGTVGRRHVCTNCIKSGKVVKP